jgi:hypothetical protein
MALGSNQPLTEMSTRNISWELKAAGACAYFLEIWEPQPSGILSACPGLSRVALHFYFIFITNK